MYNYVSTKILNIFYRKTRDTSHDNHMTADNLIIKNNLRAREREGERKGNIQ